MYGCKMRRRTDHVVPGGAGGASLPAFQVRGTLTVIVGNLTIHANIKCSWHGMQDMPQGMACRTLAVPSQLPCNHACHRMLCKALRATHAIKFRARRHGAVPCATVHAEQVNLFDEFVRASMPPPPEGGLYPTIDPSAYDPWGEAPDHCFRMACSCGYDHVARRVAGRSA